MSNALKIDAVVDWKKDTGPLRPLLHDQTISEVMVNNWQEIFIERNGVMSRSEVQFASAQSYAQCVQKLCVVAGREANRRSPFLDAHLPDGSRMNLVVPPVALGGPVLTIRKAHASILNYREMITRGSFTEKAAYFMNKAVDAKLNIIVTGGSGSGKTSLLSVLTSFIDTPQRMIVIEDSTEVVVQVENYVRMEVPQAMAGEDQITMADLLRNALRMRPDRLVIGECRGEESLDMLLAMNTGHEGSMTTIHANTAVDGLTRLESMVLRSGTNMPRSMIQDSVGTTIHMIIHMEIGSDGVRRVDEILEVRGVDGEGYDTATIFKWTPEKGLLSTGEVPVFTKRTQVTGIKFKDNFFHPDQNVKLGTPKAE